MQMISVIMACYNAGRFVEVSIESVLNQTHGEIQLIIVDDASTDGTLALAEKAAAADNRIQVFALGRNVGAGAARNYGMRYAQGNWVGIQDSDDISLPTRFERQVAFLMHNPHVGILGGTAISMGAGEREGRLLIRRESHEEMVRHIYTECPFTHSTVLARKDVFLATGGYDPALRRAQDYDLWLRSYKRFRFHNLQESLVYYRRTSKASRWRDALYSARVVWRALHRDRRPPHYCWYVMRPLVASLLPALRMRKPTV